MYKKFAVELVIRDRIVGGIPKSSEVIDGWLRGQIGDKQAAAELAAKLKDDPDMPLDEHAEKMWVGFRENGAGPYIEERQIKAMLREGMTTLRLANKHKGLRQTLQHGVFVKPEHIALEGGERGMDERVVHAMTMQGPRSALKRFDFVTTPALRFELWIVDNGTFPDSALNEMFELGQEGGLGADRSQGVGKFDVAKLEKIAKMERMKA